MRPDKDVLYVLSMQVHSSQLCIWTAAFWCLPKPRRPRPPRLQPKRPRRVRRNLLALTGNKSQEPPVQEMLRRRSAAPPQTRQARPLKVPPANPKGRAAPQDRPGRQQTPLSCKSAQTGRRVGVRSARADLYNFLSFALFSALLNSLESASPPWETR